MKRGVKPLDSTEKEARGTDQPARNRTVTVFERAALPQQPDWLTEDGQHVWLDNIGRVSTSRGAAELDSDLFANFCNLQGAIVKAWRVGEVPPITALMEVRKMMELLRIAGPSSRVVKVSDGEKPAGNPFNRTRPA
jgi:hypothetical protein